MLITKQILHFFAGIACAKRRFVTLIDVAHVSRFYFLLNRLETCTVNTLITQMLLAILYFRN